MALEDPERILIGHCGLCGHSLGPVDTIEILDQAQKEHKPVCPAQQPKEERPYGVQGNPATGSASMSPHETSRPLNPEPLQTYLLQFGKTTHNIGRGPSKKLHWYLEGSSRSICKLNSIHIGGRGSGKGHHAEYWTVIGKDAILAKAKEIVQTFANAQICGACAQTISSEQELRRAGYVGPG